MLFDQIASNKGEPGFSLLLFSYSWLSSSGRWLPLVRLLTWGRHTNFDYWWNLCL